MTRIVMDTNVLVSALLSPNGNPAKILSLVVNEQVILCYDSRIMLEYESVLLREKFPFKAQDVWGLLNAIERIGMVILPKPSSKVFNDENDKKFYEVAKDSGAYLITGNIKHFPGESWIVLPATFINLELMG